MMRWFICGILITLLVGYAAFSDLLKFGKQAEISSASISISSYLKNAAHSLLSLQTNDARNYFAQIQKELGSLQNQIPSFSRFIPLVKNLPPIFKNIDKLTSTADLLAVQIETLKQEGGQMIITQQGRQFIGLIKSIKNNIDQLSRLIKELKQQAQAIGFDLGGEVNSFAARIYSAQNFLEVFINWLESDKPHHLLVLFQNPSELRPAGGFLGSFAHITIKQGNLTNLEVQDIYDIDGQLKDKIIPPKQLQSITPNWGARDANWFFDFPASAKKVSELAELSKIYQEQKVKFDGVIAINTNVIKRLLSILGPIQIDSADNSPMVITAENFLQEIQREVETNQNKDVLKNLTPLIFDKLGKLDKQKKEEVVKIFKNSVRDKDVMIFFKDLIMEAFMRDLGVAGEIYQLPQGFLGEYLAVIDANIAGGKSDAVVDKQITLISKINNQGRITNELILEKIHKGAGAKDPWYRKASQSFVQVLAPPGSQLISVDGNFNKQIKPLVDYSDYRRDIDLSNLESNPLYFGKTVFSAWFKVEPGENKKLRFQYRNPYKINLADFQPITYPIIFDKQSGAAVNFQLSVEAPPGFIWKETGKPYFKYSIYNPPARIILELHLQKQ